MRSITVVVAVVILTTNGYAQPQLDLELHAVTQDATFANVYDPGPVTVDPTGLMDFTLALFVRAQLLGDSEATGLTTFDGILTDDGTGLWAASPLTNTDVLGIPFGPQPDLTQGRRGMTPDYVASCGCDPGCNLQLGCPTPEGWVFLPLSTDLAGVPNAIGALDDVYRVEWTTTNLTPRTVRLTLSAIGAGYRADGDPNLRVLTADDGQVDTDTFTIIIEGPACGCEYDGASGVNVFDLLAYLDLWFLGDARADIDGTPGVDLFDLLDFLDCWFPASSGSPCP